MRIKLDPHNGEAGHTATPASYHIREYNSLFWSDMIDAPSFFDIKFYDPHRHGGCLCTEFVNILGMTMEEYQDLSNMVLATGYIDLDTYIDSLPNNPNRERVDYEFESCQAEEDENPLEHFFDDDDDDDSDGNGKKEADVNDDSLDHTRYCNGDCSTCVPITIEDLECSPDTVNPNGLSDDCRGNCHTCTLCTDCEYKDESCYERKKVET